MHAPRHPGRLALLAGAATAALTACSLTQFVLPPDAGSGCASSITAAEVNGWFESGTATLNGAVKPANSVLFPDVPNCSFYKWSEQMFLWLTSPAPPRYGSGGLVMNSGAFFDVSLPDASGQRHFEAHGAGTLRAFNLRTAQHGLLDLPIVLQKGTLRLLEVLPPVLGPTGRQLVQDGDGNEVEVGDVRFPREGAPVLLDAAGQAIKAPRALLRSKNDTELRPFERRLERLEGFDRSELVQKLAFKDHLVLLDLFGNFQETEQGQADGGVLMAQNGSLVYYALTVNNVFALYRTMQGANVPAGKKFPVSQSDLDAVLAFAAAHGQPTVIDPEALAIEVKSSWVEAAGLVDADKFIQMKAIVPSYDKSNPADWVPNGTRTVTLAMVGMHVVGSTKGHPELLWSTFEHVSNAPPAAFTYSKQPSGTATVPQNTAGNWVFTADGAAAPFNSQHMRMGGAGGSHIVPVAPFTISPSNVLRTMPWGLPGSSANPNAEVISINNVVRATLDPADLRRNYFHEGTTWTIFGASPTSGNQVGTNKLENTTLETFNQGGNCFNCHSTNTTAVSHVFNETKPLF
jgi:hypothetical protein